MRKPDYLEAVRELTEEGFGWNHNEDKLEWPDTNTGVAPTKSEIDAKLTELTADYNAKQYQRDRRYPNIGEQLDMLYWDKKNDTKNWEDAIDKVKADNPKPE